MQGVETPLTPKGDRMPYATGISSVDVKTGQTSNVSIPMTAEFCRICDFEPGTPATCTEMGTVVITCSVPGHSETKPIYPSLGHLGLIPPFAASCTTQGNSEYCGACTRTGCGQIVTGTVTSALEHHANSWNWATYNSTVGKEIYCTRTGCTGGGLPVLGNTGPGGGIIFYVATTAFEVEGYGTTGDTGYFPTYNAYYLEVAKTSEGTAGWGNFGTSISGVTNFTATTAGEASLLGNGRKDTQLIVNHLATIPETGRAAQLCANRITGAADWFLPSSGELYQLLLNKDAVNEAGGNLLVTAYYWSSSQDSSNSNNAWGQGFNDSSQTSAGKNGSNTVRAVRAF
jgi:hypothetical protein